MTAEQRARHNAYHREYQLNRYHSNPEVRNAVIERSKRGKKAAGALTKEQLERRRARLATAQPRKRRPPRHPEPTGHLGGHPHNLTDCQQLAVELRF